MLLGGGHVLDQAADAQRAGRRREPGLLVGQAVGRVAEAVALLGDVGEEEVALVGEGRRLSGHVVSVRSVRRPLCAPKPVIR